MLIGSATKFGTGICIMGDYLDLDSLYKTIHFVDSKLDENSESNLLLSFAYEIRKAKDGSRGKINLIDGIKYYSTNIFWHRFILATNLLRKRLGYLDGNLDHLANVTRLEYFGMNELRKFDKLYGDDLCNWFLKKHVCSDSLLEVFDTYLTFDLIKKKDGKQRFKFLAENMDIFLFNSKERINFISKLNYVSKNLNCPLEELTISDEGFNEIKFKW